MNQETAIRTMHTRKWVLLTGEAGAGKSHAIERYRRETERSVALTASTGVAASNIGGCTLHAWSGLGTKRKLFASDIRRITNSPAGRRIHATDTLVIDEISMISGDFLQCVDELCRAVRKVDEPFGGMQMIFLGDFFQLPPVEGKRDRPDYEPFRYRFAFEAPVWAELDLSVCYLTTQYRQKDASYLELLRGIRSGAGDPRGLLTKANLWQGEPPAGMPMLFTHNADVDGMNGAKLAELPGHARAYRMGHTGNDALVGMLKRDCLSPETLALKEGASVIFTRNDPDGRFANGTTGTVVYSGCAPHWPIVQLRDGSHVEAAPMNWDFIESSHQRRVLATVTQVPLKLAWAITIHKSQGLSMDAAAIDLRRAFEFGHGYVALSRVRTLAGVYIYGWNDQALEVHPAVLAKDREFRAASEAVFACAA